MFRKPIFTGKHDVKHITTQQADGPYFVRFHRARSTPLGRTYVSEVIRDFPNAFPGHHLRITHDFPSASTKDGPGGPYEGTRHFACKAYRKIVFLVRI